MFCISLRSPAYGTRYEVRGVRGSSQSPYHSQYSPWKEYERKGEGETHSEPRQATSTICICMYVPRRIDLIFLCSSHGGGHLK